MTQIARRGVSAALLALALALSACQKRDQDQPTPTNPPAVAAPAPAPAKKRTHPPLPEDPELGAKSSAQWQEHLDEEEEHRQLCYDRDRLGQHRAVMTQLASLRQSYDRARSEADVASARAQGERLAADVQKEFDAIDPWKNSSMALPEQQALLKLLVEAYPAARLESLRGEEQKSGSLEAELERRTESIQKVLARAERCQDE